ncbi:MAG TPA: TonB-dependent receptor [Thermoanaerobaculaceae bacterium]|nr:TonB-dependent receptor [Thermoanaerobaculaceae bacterium]
MASVRNLKGWPRLAVAAAMVCLAGLLAGPAAAQISTGAVELLVSDTGKLPLPGATVKLTGSETGFERTTVTDAGGAARIAAVPPGTYVIRVELPGFRPVAEENLALRIGQVLRINVTLQLESKKTEAVTVSGEAPLVDVVKTDSSTNIVPEQIQSLPVADRDFQKLAFIAPGVQRERGGYRFISGGPVIGAGGNASDATIMVDGVDFTDPALGLARVQFSQDAVSEFRVINNRFDTEIGGSAGGALSILTRSGTNELAGTVFGYYRADSLRARSALAQPCGAISGCNNYDRGQYGFTLGGPITKDKTHFFLSTEYIKTDDVPLIFRPGGAFASQAADIPHPWNQAMLFASVDHSISDSQRFAVKYTYDRYREDNFHVGGVSDQSWGNQLNRDNWNLTLEHTLAPSPNYLNELHLQVGARKYDEPTNSTAPEEWFSVGNTLKTGTNTTGDILGDGTEWEIRDTAHVYGAKHEVKVGLSFQHLNEESSIPTFSNGTIIYYNDTRALPIEYLYGVGSADVHLSTDIWGVFVQDDWRLAPNFTLDYGLRWDLDTNGNDPDFRSPLVPNGRKRDTDNYQPRVGFSWDVAGDGANLVRGGAGRFVGRFLLVPAFTELQQNGFTGRKLYTRVSGVLFGLPYSSGTWLDPTHLSTSGILLPPSVTMLAQDYKNPYADQATLGWTKRLGGTGLFFDTEAVYVKGHDEICVTDTNWTGNATHARINPAYTNIATYTNDGRSEYKALVLSLNGMIAGQHLVTASVTLADKKNLSDDFSPVYTAGYPNDPHNPDGEWGRSQADERYRVVLSGVFKLGWNVTVAPILEYGSGQPWTKRLGYDYNGDGYNSDRAPGVGRNAQEGPVYRNVSLRITKAFPIATAGRLEIIAEAFNLFNSVNYDVNSVNSGQYLSGPTIANPNAPYVANPLFGTYSSTLPAREVQLGVRWSF